MWFCGFTGEVSDDDLHLDRIKVKVERIKGEVKSRFGFLQNGLVIIFRRRLETSSTMNYLASRSAASLMTFSEMFLGHAA